MGAWARGLRLSLTTVSLATSAGTWCLFPTILECTLVVRLFFPTGVVRVDLCPSHSHSVASGIFVRSNEALQVVANVIHANGDRGVTIVQSSQLTRVANNSISCNRQSGVKVEFQCKVELRGNGIYDNRGHGIITKGDGTAVVENDIIGNRGSGLQLLPRSDTKVSV